LAYFKIAAFIAEKRTLESYQEKHALFSREACTVLQRSVHCSPEKRALFCREPWRVKKKTSKHRPFESVKLKPIGC